MNRPPILLKEKKNQIMILTLNRPDVRNSLNFDLLNALKEEVRKLAKDKTIRTLILTGSGPKAFCAGADLKERATLSPEKVKLFILTIRDLLTAIQHLPFPVICAINGAAFGGGTEIALASDIRIASDTAVMGLTETRLAIIPGGGGTQRLPRLIGMAKAKELIFTGDKIDAAQALDIGLVNHITQPDNLMINCLEMANKIAQNGPIAVSMAKHAMDTGFDADLATGLTIESMAYEVTIPTKDRIEGLKAFKEKRKPVYRGE